MVGFRAYRLRQLGGNHSQGIQANLCSQQVLECQIGGSLGVDFARNTGRAHARRLSKTDPREKIDPYLIAWPG